MENPQRPPKARFLRAFCFSGFGFSGPGDAWDRPSWAVFLQAAIRQSLVAGRVESEVGPLGVPVQWKALLEAVPGELVIQAAIGCWFPLKTDPVAYDQQRDALHQPLIIEILTWIDQHLRQKQAYQVLLYSEWAARNAHS